MWNRFRTFTVLLKGTGGWGEIEAELLQRCFCSGGPFHVSGDGTALPTFQGMRQVPEPVPLLALSETSALQGTLLPTWCLC